MRNELKISKITDPSGREIAEEFKVSYPARMNDFTQERIDLVCEVMSNAENQTQGEYLEKFETDFTEYLSVKNAFALTEKINLDRIRPWRTYEEENWTFRGGNRAILD